MATDKADITKRLRQTRADMIGTSDEQHYWDCHDAAVEIARLRAWNDEAESRASLLELAIRRLADQDATLSVVGGSVIVEMDTLTDAEREAVEWASKTLCVGWHDLAPDDKDRTRDAAAVLRGLLDRTQPTHATPDEGSVPERGTIADEPPPDPEQDNAWLRRPYYVDPPSGWRYGFPKLYDPATDGNLTEWMIANGYPKHLADQNLPCTFTAATDSE